jgi:LysM repeat protein
MNAKPFFVLLFFGFLITIFAGGAIGDTDLTPDTPYSSNAGLAAEVLAPAADGASSGTCSGVYTVRSGDTLSAIARTCSLALADLLAANPQITNANLIHVGQKINIPLAAAPVAVPATSKQEAAASTEEAPSVESVIEAIVGTPVPTATEVVVEVVEPPADEPVATADEIVSAFETARSSGEGAQPAVHQATPRPTTGSTVLQPNSMVKVSVAGFPANVPVTVAIGQVGDDPFPIDESITDDQGVATVVVAIPADALNGQNWTVTITTIESNPAISATAVPFVIGQ